MLTPARRTALLRQLQARWLLRKDAARELLTKYGGNLPRCVVLQVGSVKISMFVEDLIQHTGERFLKEMMASPASNGIVTISVPEACMPAASLAYSLMDFDVQHGVGAKDLLDLMQTLQYCNAPGIFDAITASFGYSILIHEFVAIIQSWTTRMQAKPLSEIYFSDGQVQDSVISSVTKKLLNRDQPEQVCVILGHTFLDFSLNLMSVFSTRVVCCNCDSWFRPPDNWTSTNISADDPALVTRSFSKLYCSIVFTL